MDTRNTILVPVDFRVASLNTLRLAMESVPETHMSVLLCYCECMTDSITELLFYSPNRRVNELMTEDFKEALAILRNRFEKKLGDVTIDLFHGRNQNAFNAFLSGRQVGQLYIPKSYKLHCKNGAFDPIPYITKSRVPFHEVDWMNAQSTVETAQLESVFIKFSAWETQPHFQLRPQAE